MMRRRLHELLLATIAVLGSAALEREAISSATDDLLAVVPANMSGLVILEDISGHYQRLLVSETYEQFLELPVVKRWQESTEFHAFALAQDLMPLYFGITLADLRDQVIGDSVVLAFRPGTKPGEGDVGLLLARARSEEVLQRLIRTVTKPAKGREVETFHYRDIEYFRRREVSGRVDFVLRLGSIGVLCGQELAVKEVVDAYRDGNGIDHVDVFREMRKDLPQKCLAQFLLSPRSFDEHVADALTAGTREDRVWSKFLSEFWTSVRWTALSLRFTESVQVGWHLSVNDSLLPAIARPWAALGERKGAFLYSVPTDAIAFLTSEVDFPAAWSFFLGTVPEDAGKDIHLGADLFEQLLGGFRGKEDLLPRLGPEFGAMITEGEGGLEPRLLASIPLAEIPADEPGKLPLTVAFEHALQAAMVMYGNEHNAQTGDTWRVETEVHNGIRIHYFAGSKRMPKWIEPGFAIHNGQLILGSTPAAIRVWAHPTEKSFADSDFAKQLKASFPDGYLPMAYINVARLREFLEKHHNQLEGEVAQFSTTDPEQLKRRIELFLDVASLADRLAVGSYSTEHARNWILSVYPSKLEK